MILLIEDNPGDADLIREMLADTGQSSAYEVTHVSRVRDAIRLLEEGVAFSIIVSDVKLPDSEGKETVIRLAESAGRTPLIMITSSTDPEFALVAIKIGAQDYLPKGRFDGEMLVRSIRYAIERKNSEEALKSSEERFRSLVHSVKDYAIFHLDPTGLITSWNEGAQHIFGWSDTEIIGMPFATLFQDEDVSGGIPMSELTTALANGSSIFEGCQKTKDRRSIDAVVTTTALLSPGRTLTGYSQIIQNVTERKKADDLIRYQASHDLLTGLLNRKSFDEQFSAKKAVADLQDHPMSLFFLDIDRFKHINDSLGHAVGDNILREVAARLKSAVRSHDTICRFGGDEFLILVSDYGTEENLKSLAEKILHQFSSVFPLDNQDLHIGASMGVAIFPTDGKTIHALLKNADIALYRAKDGGRNRYLFYDSVLFSRSLVKERE